MKETRSSRQGQTMDWIDLSRKSYLGCFAKCFFLFFWGRLGRVQAKPDKALLSETKQIDQSRRRRLGRKAGERPKLGGGSVDDLKGVSSCKSVDLFCFSGFIYYYFLRKMNSDCCPPSAPSPRPKKIK